MRNWLYRFMYGRNGADNFCRFLAVTALIFIVVSMFISQPVVKSVLYYIGFLLLIYCLFREFSRNLYKRRQENQRYLAYKYKVVQKFRQLKTRISQRKYYRFYPCPNCHITTRVPKGKGRILITCPRCGAQFERKS